MTDQPHIKENASEWRKRHHYALNISCTYSDSRQAKVLREGFAKAGKTFDMWKGCVRFRKLDDLALDVIAQLIASMPPDDFIAIYERVRKTGER